VDLSSAILVRCDGNARRSWQVLILPVPEALLQVSMTNLLQYSFAGTVLLCAIAARPNAPVLANEVVAQATTAQDSAIRSVPYAGHIFAIRVETNKQTYRLGEPIEIRVSITNRADQPYSIYNIPAWALSGLKIMGSRGNQIAVTKPQIIGRGNPRNRSVLSG
jgi:hypothetical protein